MELCGPKRLHITKRTLSFQITVHLSWTPSEVTCRNEEHHENVEELEILIFQQVVIVLISV
jgi:hypothetical protein